MHLYCRRRRRRPDRCHSDSPAARATVESLESRQLLHGCHEPGAGLRAQYFDSADFTSPKRTRTEAVNFYWDNGSPDPSIAPDTFSVRWTGQLDAPSTGAYTFTA